MITVQWWIFPMTYTPSPKNEMEERPVAGMSHTCTHTPRFFIPAFILLTLAFPLFRGYVLSSPCSKISAGLFLAIKRNVSCRKTQRKRQSVIQRQGSTGTPRKTHPTLARFPAHIAFSLLLAQFPLTLRSRITAKKHNLAYKRGSKRHTLL